MTPGGPGWDRLPEADRTLILTCVQVNNFRRSGSAAVVSSIENPPATYDSLVAMVDALDRLVAVGPAELASATRPIAVALRGGLSGDRTPPALFGRMNEIAAAQQFAINALLGRISSLCPALVPTDSTEQASVFRLGVSIPPEIIGALGPTA